MSLPTISLNDGTTIPWLAFGTGTAHSRSDVSKPIELALTHGIVHIDTAQLYQNEEFVGEGLASYLSSASVPRNKIYITTKLRGPVAEGQTVRSLLVESLTKLKLDYVDLFLIHTPVQHLDRLEEVWLEMEQIKKEGLAKSIGVSNFRIKDFERIIKPGSIIPSVNQIEYHPYLQTGYIALLEYQAKYGIVTESYGGMTPLFRYTEGAVNAALRPVQERLTKDRTDGKPVSDGQVLLKWLWHKGVVAVTTTKKEERMDDYLDVINVPDLTPEEIKLIDDAGASTRYRAFKSQGHMDEN